MLLTGEQLRAARALARMEQSELAKDSGLSLETIKRLERIRGSVDANVRTLAAIVQTFRSRGIVFDSGADGVTIRMMTGAPPPAAAAPVASPEPAASPLHRLVYYSTAQVDDGLPMRERLAGILKVSRARNASLGVTGALLARDDRFLQALEGDKAAVLQVYGSICTDPRHFGLHVVENRPVGMRQFAAWSMCAGVLPADDLLLREPALAEGFRPETLSPAGALGLLSIISDLNRNCKAA